jgi:hypothetical protein
MSLLLLLRSSLHGTGEKRKTGSAWKQGGSRIEGEGREQGVEMTQTIYAHVTK